MQRANSMRWAAAMLAVATAILLATAGASRADVRLPALFGDHMVLQRGMAVPVWGTAAAGEAVRVQLAGQEAQAAADADGRWRVVLQPLEAGGPHELIVAGSNTLKVADVLVGEVWVCSGQSNMEWSVKQTANAEQEIAAATDGQIRMFTVPKRVAGAAQVETDGRWAVNSPETTGSFSAVGFYFGRQLRADLDVPIGLIHTSWGGTPAESWTSLPALEAEPACAAILKRWQETLGGHAARIEKFQAEFEAWKVASAQLEGEGKPLPAMPGCPQDMRSHPHRPAGLYHAMLRPVMPYAMRGAIWYQGESNAGRAYQYRKLFPAMIRDWRQQWAAAGAEPRDFPFLFVQLANFNAGQSEPFKSTWAELREAQTMTLSLPNTGMAVTIDIGEARDIHPRNKQDVGRRLALAARAVAYGQTLVYSGPMYESMSIEGGQVRVKFAHVGGGLAARGGGELVGFAVAGADQQFVPATATVDGPTVLVSSPQVAAPVAVRYAWADNPECNLINAEGLPASPFRTDDWPGVTAAAE